MRYLTRQGASEAVSSISNFINDMSAVYAKHGIDFGTNDVGRKNIIISAAQERFFANAIQKHFGKCTSDGRTGQPDIVIDSLDGRELECKCLSQGKNGSWSLQTDKASLDQKDKLDFLYLLYDRMHENCAVFLFSGLTSDDFKEPSPGSRGKARMHKGRGFAKCTPLIGSFSDRREMYIKKYTKDISTAITRDQKSRATKKLKMWKSKPIQISISLEPINDLSSR